MALSSSKETRTAAISDVGAFQGEQCMLYKIERKIPCQNTKYISLSLLLIQIITKSHLVNKTERQFFTSCRSWD